MSKHTSEHFTKYSSPKLSVTHLLPNKLPIIYFLINVSFQPSINRLYFLLSSHGPIVLVDLGLFYVEVPRSHSETTHSVGHLWTSHQPVAEASTRQYTTLTKDSHAHGGIRTRSLSKQAAADRRFRQRGQRDRPLYALNQI